MMTAPIGSKVWVRGRSRATVRAGPIPGRTPMSVPSETPTAAKRRYCGWSAVAKPSGRGGRTSIAAYGTLGQDLAEQPGRQPDAEELREADEHDDRQDRKS